MIDLILYWCPVVLVGILHSLGQEQQARLNVGEGIIDQSVLSRVGDVPTPPQNLVHNLGQSLLEC